jgi:hypothetical protein
MGFAEFSRRASILLCPEGFAPVSVAAIAVDSVTPAEHAGGTIINLRCGERLEVLEPYGHVMAKLREVYPDA